jgi:hypothetical protein
MIVIAEENERVLANKYYPNEEVYVMGVGINAVKGLSLLSRDIVIHNVGYAGGWKLPIGTAVSVSVSKAHHPEYPYNEDGYNLPTKEGLPCVPCYTSLDFVTNHTGDDPCVFDMELVLMCAMGFKVDSIKVVSDNLSINEYEQTIKAN